MINAEGETLSDIIHAPQFLGFGQAYRIHQHPKNLDSSCKTDLNIWNGSGKEKEREKERGIFSKDRYVKYVLICIL